MRLHLANCPVLDYLMQDVQIMSVVSFAGGYALSGPYHMKSINYITMASTGNAQYFGDLTVGRNYPGGMATQTRAVFYGGLTESPSTTTNTIDYVNIASSGAAVDFGDMNINSKKTWNNRFSWWFRRFLRWQI